MDTCCPCHASIMNLCTENASDYPIWIGNSCCLGQLTINTVVPQSMSWPFACASSMALSAQLTQTITNSITIISLSATIVTTIDPLPKPARLTSVCLLQQGRHDHVYSFTLFCTSCTVIPFVPDDVISRLLLYVSESARLLAR